MSVMLTVAQRLLAEMRIMGLSARQQLATLEIARAILQAHAHEADPIGAEAGGQTAPGLTPPRSY